MTFLLVFIFVGIGIIILTFEKFKWLIIISISIFILYLIYKYKKEKIKFKSANTSFTELCLPIIKEIDGYKKIILSNDHIVLISEYGIFIIYVINKTGIISGNIKNNILILSYSKTKFYIPNIFLEQDKLLLKYQNLIKYQIEKYIITSNDCEVIIPFENISKYKLFLGDFRRKYKNKKLTELEINNIYEIINNVNLCQKT